MIKFSELLEQVVVEVTAKAAVGRKLGGGVVVKHDAKWKKNQKTKKKWAKTSAGKKSAKMSKIRTSKTSYRPKQRQGKYRAQT